jgi:chromosome segregation ATPase
MNIQLETLIVPLCSIFFTWVLTYIITKRKQKMDTFAVEIANAEKLIGIWRSLSETQSKEIEENQAEIKELKLQVISLREDITKLEGKYTEQCEVCTYRTAYAKANGTV